MKAVRTHKKALLLTATTLIATMHSVVPQVGAIQEALRIIESEDDTCSSICINRGKVFCGLKDFSAGYCCNGRDGCEKKVTDEAPLCTDAITDPLLKYATCP